MINKNYNKKAIKNSWCTSICDYIYWRKSCCFCFITCK